MVWLIARDLAIGQIERQHIDRQYLLSIALKKHQDVILYLNEWNRMEATLSEVLLSETPCG